ncbi:universal stress protein [Streptomyces sp. HUAS TT7]|uniref:universal stress protein n=1 Tax=Streptomyces sp. HUAS TT7 TaxID=3447507 RepID=UPI003F65C728
MTHVVVAVDGSPGGARAADWAVDEADRRGVPLRLVCASLWERCDPEPADDVVGRLRASVHSLLAAEAARVSLRRPGVPVSTELLAQETVPALLDAGRGAAMLVLGSRGHGGFEGLLLGSVSLRVAARADFPVVVVRTAAPRGDGRIVLGIGGRRYPRSAAEFALAEAACRKAALDVLHSWQPDVDFSGLSALLDPSPARRRAETLLTTVADQLEHDGAGVPVRRLCPPGGAAAALLDAAAGADLLVVGSRRPFGQLGPVDHAVLHHAPCPVAVVPDRTTRPIG